ncbi:DNA/RNA non-specific endonuclease [Flavobacterium sp. WC2509]|uniref:DNA/RNA non-specific endonuclease n=1 Tax=Flavobacterium sp. WC2509 TaxID=3461406 RepID=UPI004044F220
MKLINSTKLIFLLSLILLISSCRKTSTEILEKTALKEVSTELIEKITKNSAKELSELGLSKEVTEFVAKNFDDDLTKQFLKLASENKKFLTYAKSNPAFINTWKTFSETKFASNPNQIRWINSAIDQEKYSFKKIGQSVELIDSKTNKLLGTFEKDRITAIAGEGGNKLNPLLNIHPLMPNTRYKIGNNSTYSDAFGRVKKMVCPLMSNETKVARSGIEQGLSKKLKDGRIILDEFGNPIKVKAGYYRYSDDGGHLLANTHGGISEQINVLPMTNDANKIHFKAIENKISKALSEGKTIKDYTVSPKFTGKSGRPDKFKVSYYIDGQYYSKQIMNN